MIHFKCLFETIAINTLWNRFYGLGGSTRHLHQRILYGDDIASTYTIKMKSLHRYEYPATLCGETSKTINANDNFVDGEFATAA